MTIIILATVPTKYLCSRKISHLHEIIFENKRKKN